MIYTCAFTRHDCSHFTSYPFRIQFFDKWISYFYLLDICKKVRLRYLERVRKSEEEPYTFDILTTALYSSDSINHLLVEYQIFCLQSESNGHGLNSHCLVSNMNKKICV